MVKPRLNTIDQVKELLQIIGAPQHFNFRQITETFDPYVIMSDDPKTPTEYIPAWIP